MTSIDHFEHTGFLKAAGIKGLETKAAALQRVRRLTRAALVNRAAAPAAEKAIAKQERRVARWGLKTVGKVGPDVRRAYRAHADAAAAAARS